MVRSTTEVLSVFLVSVTPASPVVFPSVVVEPSVVFGGVEQAAESKDTAVMKKTIKT
tara:strand:- start:1081 stop:1251 length:171 start_codon:yes stop_codon:yes gene_type:complete